MIVDLTAPRSVKVWLQERIIIRKTGNSDPVKFWSNLQGSSSAPIATYTPDSNGTTLIDVTDYLRAYGSSVTVCNFAYGLNQIPLTITVGGLINPTSVIIPPHTLDTMAKIVPPSLMLYNEINALTAEFYSGISSWTITGATLSANERQVLGITGAFTLSKAGKSRTYGVTPVSCGVQYALVRWVSFTGVTRTHLFEVVKCKSASADNYSLLPIDNEYREVKGRVDGCVLKLDGLDAYDYWYYADVLLSSKVEVAFDFIYLDWMQVQVTTKNVTIPDGEAGEKGKLEINIKWKRYDAVAL